MLLTAALLKVHQLSTVPYLDKFPPRWLMIAFVEIELWFAIWLFSGKLPRLTHRMTLIMFTFFSCVTFYKAISGEASCGCFGQIEVNPWYTLVFDVGVVGILLWSWPKGDLEYTDLRHLVRWRIPGTSAIAVMWLVIAAPTIWMMISFTDITAHDDLSALGSVFTGTDGIPTVVLETDAWIGRDFPLTPYIADTSSSDISGDLPLQDQIQKGNWTVILYHHDCIHCRELFDSMVISKSGWTDVTSPDLESNLAFISISDPATGERALCVHTNVRSGKLSQGNIWFAETPIRIDIHEKKVVDVIDRDELLSINNEL